MDSCRGVCLRCLIGSTVLDAPWWIWTPLIVTGAVVQLLADTTRMRWLGLLMTVLGLLLLSVGVRDDMRLREKVWRTMLQHEMKQAAEQRSAPLPPAPQAGPSEGAH